MNDKTQSHEGEVNTDRYVSFCGINCDIKADQLIALLEKNMNLGKGDPKWLTYFQQKRAQQMKSQHDNLNFIGHQTNTLYEYFEICNDEEATTLLYQIEQECC